MAEPQPPPALRPRPRRGPLLWIAAYKFVKAAFMLLAGVATLHLRHVDLPRLVLRIADRIRMDPHGQTVTWALQHVLMVDHRRLSLISAGFFTYMSLYTIEGVGLYFEQRWAEWLTIITTCLLVPVEFYHFWLKPRFIKAGIILFNLAIAAYLLWRLKRDRHRLQLLAGRETPLDAVDPWSQMTEALVRRPHGAPSRHPQVMPLSSLKK